MKVLVVTERPDQAEAATFVGLHRDGVDIELMAEPDAGRLKAVDAAGVPVTGLTIRRKYDRDAIRSIRERLLDGGHDILHLLTRAAIRNGLAAARGLDVKIVVYRGAKGLYFYDPTTWMTYLNPRVDRIICVSEGVRRDLVERRWLGLRVSPGRLVTIHKGHRLEWYSEPPVDLAAEGIPEGAFTAGFLANVRPGKRLEDLIDSAAFLPSDSPVHFLLIGRRTDTRRFRRRIARTPDPSRFHVLGWRGDGARIIAACDVLVHPSESEGLSRVVIEAMAHRRPVIVTPTCVGDLVEPDVSGIAVPARDPEAIAAAIERLRRDPEERARMGEAARERIREVLSVDQTVRATRRLYEELMADRPRHEEKS